MPLWYACSVLGGALYMVVDNILHNKRHAEHAKQIEGQRETIELLDQRVHNLLQKEIRDKDTIDTLKRQIKFYEEMNYRIYKEEADPWE